MKNKEYFLEKTTLITYNKDDCRTDIINHIDEIKIDDNKNVKWFNTYGEIEKKTFKRFIFNNKLNDFLYILLKDGYNNKVINLNKSLFVSMEVFRIDGGLFSTEKMSFILCDNFIWSIQEKEGDYFDSIREKIKSGIEIVRSRKSDYLLFSILDTIVDTYEDVFKEISEYNEQFSEILDIKPTPAFISRIEGIKQELLKLKKSAILLRDTVSKLIKIEAYNDIYFEEIKEQINNLIVNIDFEIQTLESNINLIFSIQGHHLNEVMKTLTVFSIIFIPITFLSGLYGMNFKYMPELETKNGYFILLAVMLTITVLIIYYLKKKKWW